MQFGAAAGIAAPGRFDLDHLDSHRGEIPGCGGPGDDPAEIEHANAGERHPVLTVVGGHVLRRLRVRVNDAQPEWRPRHTDVSSTDLDRPPEMPVRQLCRGQLLSRLA